MTNTFKQFALCEENGTRVILYYSSELTLVRTARGKWKKIAELSHDEFPTAQETFDGYYAVDAYSNENILSELILEAELKNE